jgi:NADH-quinone oxidoreductase subunit H
VSGLAAPARHDALPAWLNRLGPAWVLVCGFASLSVLPVGATYPSSTGHVALVGAQLDASALVPVALLCSSALGFAWMAWSVRDAGARSACLHAGSQTLAHAVALGLAMLPLLLVAGSLDLMVVASRQDTAWPLAQIARGFSLPWPDAGWVAGLALPAWGVVANPLAVLLVFVAGLGATRLPPFDAAAAEAEARTTLHAEGSTQRQGSAVLGDAVNALLVAGLVVSLGFGAWSLPWLDDATLAARLTSSLGASIGTFACAAIHVASFSAKTVLVLIVQRHIAKRWAPMSAARTSLLCLRVIYPIALANLFATGIWLVARAGLA